MSCVVSSCFVLSVSCCCCCCRRRHKVQWGRMNDRPSSSSGDAGVAPPGPSPATEGGGGWAMVQDSNGPAGPDTIQHHDQSPFVTHSSNRNNSSNSSSQYHHNHHHQHNNHVYHQPHLIKGLLLFVHFLCSSLPNIPKRRKKEETRQDSCDIIIGARYKGAGPVVIPRFLFK